MEDTTMCVYMHVCVYIFKMDESEKERTKRKKKHFRYGKLTQLAVERECVGALDAVAAASAFSCVFAPTFGYVHTCTYITAPCKSHLVAVLVLEAAIFNASACVCAPIVYLFCFASYDCRSCSISFLYSSNRYYARTHSSNNNTLKSR